VPCGPFCGQGNFDLFSNLGFNFTGVSNVNFTTGFNGVIAGGTCINAPSGSQNSYNALNFAPGADNSAMSLGASASMNVGDIIAAAQKAAVALAAGAQLIARFLNVSASATLSYSCSSNSVLNFSSMSISGTLSVSGSGNLFFPPTQNGAQGSGGTISLSGGPSLSGFVTSTINLLQQSGTTGNPYALIAPGAFFSTSADIIGSLTSQFNISGSFSFSGGSCTANISISASGTFNIKGTGMNGGALTVQTSGSIVIEATASGARTIFSSVSACAHGATVHRKVSGSFAAGTAPTSGTVFSYNATGSVTVTAPGCSIVIEDSLGVVVTLNTNGASSQDHSHVLAALPGRILASDSGTATWGGKSLTYNTGSNGAGSSAAPFFLLIVASIAFALFSY